MATMERGFSFRKHEGHMFFIYDHRKKKEEDDPKDAILYFYPRSVKIDDQIALVGGIIGITDFCLEFLPQEMPQIVKLSAHNFALLQHGDYIIGLAGSMDIPTSFLVTHMQFLWSTFVFYQGSITALKQRQSGEQFLRKLNMVWDIYLPLVQSQGDLLGQAFQTIPYIKLHKSQGSLFLHASHILQRSLKQKGVLAGALFSKNKVLCTQLSNVLTRKLLLLMMQTQFPSVEVSPSLELPGGVQLVYVYLTRDEYESLTHRRNKRYSSSLQSSGEENMAKHSTSSNVKTSIFSDSAISSGGEQVNSHLVNGSDEHHLNCSSHHTFEDSVQGNSVDFGKVTACTEKSKAMTSEASSESYLLSEKHKLFKIEEVKIASYQKEMSNYADIADDYSNCDNFEQLSKSGCKAIESQASVMSCDVGKVDEKSSRRQSKGNESVHSEYYSSNESTHQKKLCSSVHLSGSFSLNDEKKNSSLVENSLNSSSNDKSSNSSLIDKNDFFSSNDNSKFSNGESRRNSPLNDKSRKLYPNDQIRQSSPNHQSGNSSPYEKSGNFSLNNRSGNSSPNNKSGNSSPKNNSRQSPANNESRNSSPYDKSFPHKKNGNLSPSNNKSPNEFDNKDNGSCDEDVPVSESQKSQQIVLKEHPCQMEKESDDSLGLEVTRNNSRFSSLELVNDNNTSENNMRKGQSNDIVIKVSGHLDVSNSSNSCVQKHVGLEDSFTQQISASGDDSSLQSSSCEVRKEEDTSHKSSLVSLANSDAHSSKDRLTFDNLDSENSDFGIASPDPELPPMFQGNSLPVGLPSLKVADGEDVVSGSFHSCHEGQGGLNVRLFNEMKRCTEEGFEWKPQQDNLIEMNLYIQGHSDTLLVLLIDKEIKCNKSYIHSLWKCCLSHLAELDFEVKNVERHTKDESENIAALYQYMKYDSFSHSLYGSAIMPVTSLANEMVDSCVRMHKDFIFIPDLVDATYKSHTACSFGRRSLNSETYFQIGIPNRGGVNPGERTFHLEQTAEKCLIQDHKINLL